MLIESQLCVYHLWPIPALNSCERGASIRRIVAVGMNEVMGKTTMVRAAYMINYPEERGQDRRQEIVAMLIVNTPEVL